MAESNASEATGCKGNRAQLTLELSRVPYAEGGPPEYLGLPRVALPREALNCILIFKPSCFLSLCITDPGRFGLMNPLSVHKPQAYINDTPSLSVFLC